MTVHEQRALTVFSYMPQYEEKKNPEATGIACGR